MKNRFRLFSLAIGCALAACQGGADDDTDEASESAPSTPTPAATSTPTRAASGPRTVTLITGHRVTVHGERLVTIDPPRGSTSSAAVHATYARDHLVVMPAEAELLVATGRLDRRLFDVTQLLELGYDARRTDLPLIVTYETGAARASSAASALTAAGARVTRSLASIGGSAVRASKSGAASFWSAMTVKGRARGAAAHALADGVATIWLDGARRPVLDHSAPQIGAPDAWAAGYTGQGVTVAVLDSGIDADHPDFAGRIVDARSFVDGAADASDDVGHGTHVASIVAGSGAAEGGRYRGVAPDADLLIGKVCDVSGFCFDSDILAGMEWAAQSGAAVVNLSLGGFDGPELDPLEQAINALTAQHGTLFVAAAGNEFGCGGPDGLQVASPSTADAALSVAAVDRDDVTASFSCRGPRAGDAAVKPDIAAPGVDIVAGRAAGTPLGDLDPVGDFYARMSGTSMATPHVAGAAAILAQQHPDWQAGELKAALMASARATDGVFLVGAGRADLTRAITQEVFSSPVSLTFGVALWPHDDDEPIARVVTYQNRGASPVTFQLAFDVRDPSGAPAAGMFSVDPAEVTVPPGGEAQATVTADTRAAGPDGIFAGALVATAAGASMRTPLSLVKEVESYEVEIVATDRGGAPVEFLPTARDLETGEAIDFPLAVGSTRARLPRASYAVDAGFIDTEADGRENVVLMIQPRLDITGPTTITMDARLARPVAIRVPEPSARRVIEVVDMMTHTGAGIFTSSAQHHGISEEQDNFGFFYTLEVGPSVPNTFQTLITSTWAEPGSVPGQRFADSPFIYHAIFLEDGGFLTGFDRSLDPAEMAVIDERFAQSSPVLDGVVAALGFPDADGEFFGWGSFLDIDLPARRTAHYLAENLRWLPIFLEVGDSSNTGWSPFDFAPFEAGPARNDWNKGVLGPNLRFPEAPNPLLTRTADRLRLGNVTHLGDSDGHHGSSSTETGTARLFRNGTLLGEHASSSFVAFQVPPEAGNYRLEVESNRGGLSPLSTQVNVAWTFRSEAPRDATSAVLPAAAVRFTPPLDDENAAPRGRPFVIPFEVSRQFGAPRASVDSVRVEASFDGGQRWRRALVLRFGDRGFALVFHPDRGSSVSLRADARDRDGSRVEQTILGAYRLRDDRKADQPR